MPDVQNKDRRCLGCACQGCCLGRRQLCPDLPCAFYFSAGGKWVVALVAELVLAFAILPRLGILRVRKSTTTLNSAGWPIQGIRDAPSPDDV